MSIGIRGVLSCGARPTMECQRILAHRGARVVPRTLSRQGVIHQRREVTGNGDAPLRRDRLSLMKRQFVEVISLPPVSEALLLQIDGIGASACPVLALWHYFCYRQAGEDKAGLLITSKKGEEAMHVREIMATDVEVVDRNDTLRMVEERMTAKQLRHLPVVEQGELVGLVTQRDLFKAAMSSAMGYGEKAQKAFLQSVRVKEIMVYPVISVTPETSIAEAADMMMQRGIGCLPVVEMAKLVGIVTKTDLLRCLRTMSTEVSRP